MTNKFFDVNLIFSLLITDLLLDEDATLMSFFSNFADQDDEEELVNNLTKYVGDNCFGSLLA